MLAILKIHTALNTPISNILNKHSEDAGLEKVNASEISWVLREICWFPLSHWLLSFPTSGHINWENYYLHSPKSTFSMQASRNEWGKKEKEKNSSLFFTQIKLIMVVSFQSR